MGSVAFVLGGGGHLGAYQVGMLRALTERSITPDLVVGTSVGALNGAAIAADPSIKTVEKLGNVWRNLDSEPAFAGSFFSGARRLVQSRTHVHANDGLRDLISRTLPVQLIEDLSIRFECVAACIERAAEHWFTSGSLVDAILASSAVPGMLPPVQINGEHFVDGGIVNSIPIERAVADGASTIYVMHVGRVEQPLQPPRHLLDVAMVSFEIARRHRFARDMASIPEGVTVHVLPTGETGPVKQQLRFRDYTKVGDRIQRSYEATKEFLDGLT